MIHLITADVPSFKIIRFKPGFNAVLADRTKESTRKDSRNGLGKSSLIEVIHFCMGANKGETLSKKALEGWTFTMEIDLAGRRYAVSRNTKTPSKITIEGDCSRWPIKPELEKSSGYQVMKTKDWIRVLGALMFGLQPSYPDYDYAPSFRALISYFIRRNGRRGGFLDPFQQYKNQLEWDKQLHNAFLLDLNWDYASKWQILKDRLNVIEQIRKEARSGILAEMMGSTGELEAMKIRLEADIEKEENLLSEFRVHPKYKEIEKDANELTYKIHEICNSNLSDRQVLELYEKSLDEEQYTEPGTVTRMFEEAQIVLPETVTKRLNDVLKFHKQVIQNRQEFLSSEMDRIRNRIAQREELIAKLSEERAEKMMVLQKHGALEEYTKLQNNHQTKVANLKDLNLRLENLKKFEQGKTAVTVDQALLQQEATTDYTQRKAQREKAILLFNSNSNALYQAPGTLSIDIAKTGYKYKVEIERSGSHGIGNMKIFCYDLMLAQIWSEKKPGQIVLIHDSILFADVDERQKALALELAAKESQRRGFQYICTLNSDTLPTKDFSKGFMLDPFVRHTFTDATPDGGLFGIRF